MKSNAELKELAWRRLWTDRWFGRLFGGGLLLGLCGYVINAFIDGVLVSLNVQSWVDYAKAVALNRAQLTTPVPYLTSNYVFHATTATILKLFFAYVTYGIAAYGGAVILRRCLANAEQGWLKAAFGGFGQPFGMFWLFIRQVFIYVGWALAPVLLLAVATGVGAPFFRRLMLSEPQGAAVAGTAFVLGGLAVLVCIGVPFYRYRYLWLVKAEHPEWSAGACLRSCRALMRGNLMQSVRLDCAYWKPLALVLLLTVVCISAAASASMVPPLLGMISVVSSFCVLMATSVVIGQYISVGQAFLYQELKDGMPPDGERSAADL
ncbi:MAG: hypothetical protein ACI4RD_09480 [Kiritimatiellia bacterium]